MILDAVFFARDRQKENSPGACLYRFLCQMFENDPEEQVALAVMWPFRYQYRHLVQW